MLTFPYCDVLSRMDDAVFAALLERLCAEWRPKTPGLVALRHRREREVCEMGHRWWLHVALVFTADAPEYAAGADAPDFAPAGDAEATHWRLARAVQHLADRWGHCWPVLHYHRADAPLEGHHAPRAGVAIPEPPPARVPFKHAPPKAAPPAEPPPAEPAPAAPAPSTQRSFGF